MSQLYNAARRAFLTDTTVNGFSGQIDWINDDFGALLVHADYVFDAAHTDLTDIADTTAVRLSEVLLTGMAATGTGIATADNAVFTSVPVPPDGESVDAVIIYRSDTGDLGTQTEADCVLVAYIDSATGLGVVPNGGDITVVWDGGTGNIFRL